MNFKDMVESDLSKCNDFGGVCSHVKNGTTTPLEYLCFDENSDVIFEEDEYQGVTTTVPALTVQTSKAEAINHQSLIIMDDMTYGVIQKNMKKDGTTVIYMDRK